MYTLSVYIKLIHKHKGTTSTLAIEDIANDKITISSNYQVVYYKETLNGLCVSCGALLSIINCHLAIASHTLYNNCVVY